MAVVITNQSGKVCPALFLEKLKSCYYLSFDEEMTGINTKNQGQGGDNNREDDPDERYFMMREPATKYIIIQFGVCLFHLHEESPAGEGEAPKTKMVASTYNWFLFPDSGEDISLSVSAIQYGRRHNMNFGKWMSFGVTLVDKKQAAELRKAPATARSAIVLTKQPDIEFVSRQTASIVEFVADESRQDLILEGCNTFLCKAINQYLETNHPSLVSRKVDNAIGLTKLEAKLGFRLVFEALIEAKKPMVGHNCFFDLMFMMRWLDGPLCENLTDFKQTLNALFPEIYDTKFVCTSGILQQDTPGNTSLQPMFNRVVQGSKGTVDEILIEGGIEEGVAAHDAGYDAYMTGCLFGHQLKRIGGLERMRDAACNRLFMMQSLYHIDLQPGFMCCCCCCCCCFCNHEIYILFRFINLSGYLTNLSNLHTFLKL